jgi:ribosomal protein S18 acetylase RimI-like enzyme
MTGYGYGMNKLEVYVRPANITDASEIVEMQSALAEYYDYDMNRFGITTSTVHAIIQHESQTQYFVAHSPEERIGVMLCHRVPLSWSGTSGIYIEDLYVKPEFRGGLGVGTLLVAQACELALLAASGDEASAFVRLDTSMQDNYPTIRFYRDHLKMQGKDINFRLQGAAVMALAERARN